MTSVMNLPFFPYLLTVQANSPVIDQEWFPKDTGVRKI